MNKFKILFGYILGFTASIFFVILTVLLIFRVTIFNEKYVIKVLDSVNYYEKVYEDIKKDFSNSLHSSGLDDSVLDSIYSFDDTKRDIKSFIASLYSGSKFEVNSSEIRKKLNSNIDQYLKEKNLEASKDSLNKYIDGVVSIYENQIILYGYLNGGIQKFVKVSRYFDLFIGFFLILFVIIFIILRYGLHKRYSGVVTLSSGFMIIYLKCFVYDLIDFKNIVIISDEFSKVIRVLFIDIGNYMLVIATIFIVIGIVLNVKSSMLKVKGIKRF